MGMVRRLLLLLINRLSRLPVVPKKIKLVGGALLAIAVIGIFVYVLQHHTVALLQPRGEIGYRQRQLMMYAAILAAIVIIPVYIMTAVIAIKYREDSKHPGKYTPNWDTNKKLEIIWWGIPCVIILILAVITWQSSHALDPYKSLANNQKQLNVQVIALDWKWLFIYPDQGVATINELDMPVDTAVHFDITADAPMNSFWIPQLGGQVYAMPGMSTVLNLRAGSIGTYRGASANISGKGFSGMTFAARVKSSADFNNWVNTAKASPNYLSQASYDNLVAPSENNPVAYYGSIDPTVYDTVVMKYMGH